ncbi:hypothetical protein GCM10009809_16530 [Isoptericola hypogeus]|uniref:WD40-like Beta Propeller Repeat n=1 Tax=Isoptericola hypogeus TaxID=300179 RepID=A0ABP4VBI2_9MICO
MARTGRSWRAATVALAGAAALAVVGIVPASGGVAGAVAPSAVTRLSDDHDGREGRPLDALRRLGRGSGTQLAWTRFVDAERTAARIVVGDPGGQHVREVTTSSDGVWDIGPRLSPDGRWIAFERDTETAIGIVLVRTDGTDERALDLGCTWPCAAEITPMWDYDGSHLYFSRVVGPFDQYGNAASAALHRVDLRSQEVERVSPPGIDGVYEDSMASVAPDGTLVFLRVGNPLAPGARPSVAVHRMDRDGTDVRQLTPWSLGGDHPKVSPARSGPSRGLVVFDTYGTGGAPEGTVPAVATVPLDCRPLADCERRIRYLTSPTSAPVAHSFPDWSPDGRRVVAVRADGSTGSGDLWTMRWDGRDVRRLTASPLLEIRPDWGIVPRR